MTDQPRLWIAYAEQPSGPIEIIPHVDYNDAVEDLRMTANVPLRALRDYRAIDADDPEPFEIEHNGRKIGVTNERIYTGSQWDTEVRIDRSN